MATYNGHKNWAYWNVALWLNNDEGLYRMVCDTVRRVKGRQAQAQAVVDNLAEFDIVKTPDGARYSVSAVRAALSGWE